MSLWKPKYKDSNGNIQDLQIAANCLTDGTHLVKLPTLTTDKTIAVTSDLNSYLPLSGGTLSGDLIINASHRDTYYASNVCRHFSSNTPSQFVIKTKIKYVSSILMPLIRIYGYAYGEQSPIELRVGFYIYNDTLGWAGAVSTGAWKPEVYLFRYTENSTNYVAVGFKGSCYFCGFQVDVQVGALGQFDSNFSIDGWSTIHNGADTTQNIIPAVGTDKCVLVPYKTMKTDISGTAANASKLNNQEASYYLNYNNLTNKPTIPTVNNGTLTIQKNGTNVQTFTANQSSNVTANITVPTTLDDISDGSTRKLVNYLPLSGGTMTGNIVLSNNKYISGKTTSSTEVAIFGPQTNNNIQLGNTSFNDIVSYNNILPSSTNTKNLGTSSYQWKAVYGNYISGNTFEATSYYNTYGESVDLTSAYVVTDDSDDAYETRYGLRAIKNVTSNGTYKLTMPEKSGTIGLEVEIVDLRS